MENFYFPCTSESKNYQYLVQLFEVLKIEYIRYNGIMTDSNIDIKQNILDTIGFYELFNSNVNAAVSNLFDQNPALNNFNLEELFFINRMAFLRFKRVGVNLTVFDLYENLKMLEV